ncbi:hypothetical protein ACPZ19_21940 [Amycolatopsis lurida]
MMRRVGSTLIVTAITLGTVTATATGASAALSVCRVVPNVSDTCLRVTYIGGHDYAVHVGIDVYMSQADAEAIVAGPGNAFLPAILVGDDPGTASDDDLAQLPLTGEVAGSDHLAAEFYAIVRDTVLNEDSSSGETDELYARIRYVDPRDGLTHGFFTGGVTGKF